MNPKDRRTWLHHVIRTDLEQRVLAAVTCAKDITVKCRRDDERVLAVRCEAEEWDSVERLILRLCMCLDVVQLVILAGLLRGAGFAVDAALDCAVTKAIELLRKRRELGEMLRKGLQHAGPEIARLTGQNGEGRLTAGSIN